MFQTTDPNKPGYMAPVEPHKPRPMAPSGTVEPPKNFKARKANRMTGKDKNRAKGEAERLVAKAINSPEWMVLAFRLNPDTGAVILNYKMCEFPIANFEEAAGLFAQVLTEQLGEAFGPKEQAEMRAAAERKAAELAAAQTSEPVPGAQPGDMKTPWPIPLPSDSELNSLPASLGGASEPEKPAE